jgi:predicted ATPase
LAGEFADGAAFADLSTLRDPALVPTEIADAIGVHDAGEAPLEDTLADALGERELLLVLDNFEHLLPAAGLLSDLLESAPRLKLVVTSRTLLRISGEHEFVVPPLALPSAPGRGTTASALARVEAVALFVQRARAVRPEMTVTDANSATVAEICRRLDGLPLALELAAARVKVLSLDALLERLDNRLSVLTGGGRDQPSHKQTLRATIAWSHDLLSRDEQALFARLAVFRGGFTLDAAEAVARADQPDYDVLEHLASLLDKSLLMRGTGCDGEARFAMLATVNEFATELLDACDDADAVRRRHAEHFLQTAERLNQGWESGADQANCLHRYSEEQDNFRASLEWAEARVETEVSLRLGAALRRFWGLQGGAAEGHRWLDTALAADDGANPSVRAQALLTQSYLLGLMDPLASRETAEEARQLFVELGDRRGEARALLTLTMWAVDANEDERAEHLGELAVEVFREVGDVRGVANAINSLAYVLLKRGATARAAELFEEALANARRAGDEGEVALVQHNLGLVALEERRWEEAASYLRFGLECARRVGTPITAGYCIEALGAVAAAVGEATHAARLLGAGDAMIDALGVIRESVEARVRARAVESLGLRLGNPQLEIELRRGAGLSLNDAVDLAMQVASA